MIAGWYDMFLPSMLDDYQLLTQQPPESDPDRYTYDPADPTPAVGGTSTITFGPRDNRELEQRPGVLTYTTPALTEQLEITGPVAAELFVDSSRPHTDFFVRLCDVDEKGKSQRQTVHHDPLSASAILLPVTGSQ